MVQEAAQLIRRYYRNTYKYGSGSKTICKKWFFKKKQNQLGLIQSLTKLLMRVFIRFPDLAPGGSDDWAYNLGIKYSFTFELQDRGRYGFLLPPSHISRACNEALIAVKTIALKVIKKTSSKSPVQTDWTTIKAEGSIFKMLFVNITWGNKNC